MLPTTTLPWALGNSGLFVAQCDHRIDAGCAARRDVACDQRHNHKRKRDACKYERILRAYMKQHPGEHPRKRKCSCKTDEDSDQNQPKALPYYQLQDIARLRSESHPDTELIAALRNGIRDHTVNPDPRQKQ